MQISTLHNIPEPVSLVILLRLNGWKNVFPIEPLLANPSNADLVYRYCVAMTIRHGMATAAYYATISVGTPTNCRADICLEAEQRTFIARCNIDG